MSSKKDIDHLIENFVSEERNTSFNPFLATRVMATIDQGRDSKLLVFSPKWRIAVIAFSLLAAVFTGIATGGMYQSASETTDVVLMNDGILENFGLYNEIGN